MNIQLKAKRLARKIPLTTNHKDKCKAVHAWHKVIKEMLRGNN